MEAYSLRIFLPTASRGRKSVPRNRSPWPRMLYRIGCEQRKHQQQCPGNRAIRQRVDHECSNGRRQQSLAVNVDGAARKQRDHHRTGFGATQGNSEVRLNGLATQIGSWSDTSIGVTIPPGATSGPMTVAVAPSMNSSNPATFKVCLIPCRTVTSAQSV